jgi:predicted ATPase/DNA-binding SARP family transcriptional activator
MSAAGDDGGTGELQFGLLGQAVAWRDGHELALGSPQQRALFALLLLHRGEAVSTDRMIEALWPGDPPPNAVPVLRTYVSRLRAAGLGPEVLSTCRDGYLLRAGAIDADRFEALVAAGRTQREAGDAVAAEELLHEALALVRGPPLNELPDDPAARSERGRLDELVLEADEELVEARLAQGRHRELLPALRAATASRPLRERAWGQLMVALYRSGRQAEALAAYRAAQRVLDEDLGIAPGPQLRELERMILVGDALLELPSLQGLPRFATRFIGRETELAALTRGVRDSRLLTIVGPAGAGKTRLAAEFVVTADRRLWWVDLGSVAPGRVVAWIARTLEVPEVPGRAPVDLVVARLQEAPALLVLDNCEHVLDEAAAVVARILDGDPRALVLATSREALRADGEAVRVLEGLPAAPAGELFVDRAGRPCDTATVAEIVRLLDGLPLAIELAAAQLRALTLPELRQRLRALELPEGDPTAPRRRRALEAAIGCSYDLLAAAEQEALRALSIFPVSFDPTAAEAVAGDSWPRLVDASLVAAEPPQRFRLLQTVRAFALPRLERNGERDAAGSRHRDFYAALAEDVDANMTGAGLPTWLPLGRSEHVNFQAALHFSLDAGDGERALQLASSLCWFWWRSGFVGEGRELIERALSLAGLGSRWRPRGLAGRAWLAQAAGAPETLALADEAITACERVDPEQHGTALSARACALIVGGRLDEARATIAAERHLAVALGQEESVAFADQLLGNVQLAAGDLEGAEALLTRSRDALHRLRGGALGGGFTLVDLARVKLAQDRPDDAAAFANEALADFRRRQDPRGTAASLICLAHAHGALGDIARERVLLAEALELAERWGYISLAAEAGSALGGLPAGGVAHGR